MGGKRITRFFTSLSASTPKRQQRTPQAEAEFKRTAEKRQERLNQIINPPPRIPAPAPPPPPEWAEIVGNDDHAWIDEPDDNDEDGEVVRPSQYVRRRQYRKYFAKRQDFFREWAHLEDQMMATYLYCQHTTKNWTTQESYHEVKPSGCSCSPNDHHPPRQIDLIDVLGHQSPSMSFCKCQPEVIQLLHRGYIASSPSKPRTAFSVRYIQLYHDLWEQSGLNKSGYVQGLIKFISRRTRRQLTARGIQQKSRILRVPFSNAHDVYARISRLQTSLLHVVMLHTKEELWAAKCAQCFGPAEASKDQPLDAEYPSIFVKPTDIQRNEVVLETTSNVVLEGGHNVLLESSGKWLLTRMQQAHETVKKSQTLLTNIYAFPNPYQPGHLYTEDFFDKQWKDQREAIVSPKVQQEIQKLELGKLLCLEAEHDKAWQTLIHTPEQAIARARLVGDLQKRIAAQRRKVGSDAMTNDLSEKHTNLLLKLWYSKTAMRQLFLALKEEKHPLEIVQQVGMSTKLGQRGQQKVLAAIKTCAAKLQPALDIYSENLTGYKAAFPDRPAPRPITFDKLLAIEADDAFWNDGLFTYDDQPWAIDTPTQTGMCALARFRRVFQMLTSTQPGDASLIRTWHYQVAQVLYLDNQEHSSMIDGDFETVIDGVQAFYNIAPEFRYDEMALDRMEENVPEEPDEDEFPGDEDIEVVYEKFMHLDEIHDVLRET
ncbi:uncharacterized protein MELLADRAFT_62940 [Melampsora larici-populina 98AG31]|uniref:CxC1-like cysteine cluster associated with KDZ transposases domain-containing protein n=1 Tax=Melampsora larici-populina (strain 98AG31 / pathotype 3-4-7) TaxID=747676 RepID=F4RLG9_MELLP|nr:uncharacterized protein MELLADRAFT_62940 [Melampsora larici-populina 98AG31]EGG06766.1 hypothetical protein MELLADRAFT_62940 [Melampsora larici-populina 98AG31]